MMMNEQRRKRFKYALSVLQKDYEAVVVNEAAGQIEVWSRQGKRYMYCSTTGAIFECKTHTLLDIKGLTAIVGLLDKN